MRYRFEQFGGIISHEDPPFLAFVDRSYMQELGLGPSGLWNGPEKIDVLSAPTEIHLSITNQCDNHCVHCYMDSGEKASDELSTVELMKVLQVLADFGVFHIALGGGEALLRKDLFEIAEYAHELGLVPNLTVSGKRITKKIAARMKVFGQVNVSIDSLDSEEKGPRDAALFKSADNAISLLVNEGVPCGINCVVGKHNYAAIPELFAYGDKQGVNEIEFLRFKPAGRGKVFYDSECTTDKQNRELLPLLQEQSQKYKIPAKIDCSFIPMLVWHNPPKTYLEATATYGCEAGNILLGAKSNGKINGCSFLPVTGISLMDLQKEWKVNDYFLQFRNWKNNAQEPCNSCDYIDICKGGCHAVALYKTGTLEAPDPGCPRVVEYTKKQR